jgi:hypothetical protein
MKLFAGQSLTGVLGEAVDTTAPSFVAQYIEQRPPRREFERMQSDGTLTAAAGTMVAAPATGLARELLNINVHNGDVVSHVVTITLVDGTDSYQLWQVTLAAGASFTLRPALSLLLDGAAQSLVAEMSASPVLPVVVVAEYLEINNSTEMTALAHRAVALADDAETEVIAAPSAGYLRELVGLTVHNPNSSAATCTLSFADGDTRRALRTLVLAAGGTFELSRRMALLDDTGAVAENPATGYILSSAREAASGVAGLNAQSMVIKEPASKAQASGIASLNAQSKVVQEPASKAQASGIASLNAQSKVVEEPASKAQASGIASLDENSKVVQDPANATATPTASKIPIADGNGKLDGWVSLSSYLPLTGTGSNLNMNAKRITNLADPTGAQDAVTWAALLSFAQSLNYANAVLDRDLTAPPAEPQHGDRYIVAAQATGDWETHDLEIVEYVTDAWVFTAPTIITWVPVDDEDIIVYWTGSAWSNWTAVVNHALLLNLTVGDPHTQYALKTFLSAVVDSAAGADQVGMTAITETGESSTVQAVIEALITRLKAVTDGVSGADLIGATGISGLTGATVQALLEYIAGLIVTVPTAASLPKTDENGMVDPFLTHTIEFILADASTTPEIGDGKAWHRVSALEAGMNLVGGAAHNTTDGEGATTIMLRRDRAGTMADMLSTAITIDTTERDSKDAAACVVNAANDDLAEGDLIWVDLDAIGTGAFGTTVQAFIRKPLPA